MIVRHYFINETDAEYLQGNYNFGSIADGQAVKQAVLGADSRLFSASNAIPAINLVRSDKTGRESVIAAYLMGGLKLRNWELTGGARYEYTDVKNTVWRTGRVTPANPTAASRYDDATGTTGFSGAFAAPRKSWARISPACSPRPR